MSGWWFAGWGVLMMSFGFFAMPWIDRSDAILLGWLMVAIGVSIEARKKP